MGGWIINREESETPYSYIHNNSGEFTVSESLCAGAPTSCSPYAEYHVKAKIKEDTTYFDEFEDSCGEISKELSGISCNQDALVMWFNYDDNKSYNDILDNNSVFYIKNVDECRHVIISNNLRVGSQKFDTSAYTDSGFPSIVPTDYLCGFGSTDYSLVGNKKYNDNTTYKGHKIKYSVSGDTIPSNTLVDNNELVELYFPSYSVSGDGQTIVKNIADGAFSGNTRLSAVTLNNVVNIGNGAFDSCSSLEYVDWGHKSCHNSRLETIGNYAFEGCEAKCIITPGSLKSIGDYAFLTISTYFIKLNDGLTNVGKNAFNPTRQSSYRKDVTMSSLFIPNSVKNIGENAFGNGITNIFWLIQNDNPLANSDSPILFEIGDTNYDTTTDIYIGPNFDNYQKMKNIIKRFSGNKLRFYINENLVNIMQAEFSDYDYHFFDTKTWRDEHTTNWPYVRRTS